MTLRRSSRTALPRLTLSAAALALTAAATAVIAPQPASAAEPLPAGSTLVLSAMGSSTPGLAQAFARATLTAPDDSVDRDPNTVGVQGDLDTARDELADQDVTLSVDHGFFTTGGEVVPSVVGAYAGNLAKLGTTITGKTNSQGDLVFQLGIERDPGFDDDGNVTAVVTATAGALVDQESAAWSTANPLNGQVEVVLSPTARQENPVAPAVSGDRTWYDVFTRDQFGNPVDGEPVYLDFTGKLDDFDYSEDFVTSDLGHEGDLWVVSFVPGDLTVTGTWDAPSYRYSSTTGSAASGTGDVSGGATASFYDIDFNATSFALAPAVGGDAAVGTAVTHLATVVDQRGNPVRGFEVRFFRFGPEPGETAGEGRVDQVTNSRGQASYSFVGSKPGTAKVTAVVSDGISHRTLVSEVRFRYGVSAVLKATRGGAESDATDALTVRASKVAAGAKVSLYTVKGSKLKRVKGVAVKLDKFGKATLAVADRNGRRKTTYVVVVAATPTTFAATSPALKLH